MGGGREVVLVSGEPGVGKSTVVAGLARRVHERGACVLMGHYDEELTLSYQGFAEAIGHYVAHASAEVLQAHIDADGAELSVMVPGLAQRVHEIPTNRSADPDTMRYLVFSAVVGLLAKASTAAPIVLVLEDLQWADIQSIQLLRHLVRESETSRLLIIGTYRDDIDASHPLAQLLGALHREQRVSRMALGGLDEAGVLAYLKAAWGGMRDDGAADLAHAVYGETDGNPFFVSEVLRHLLETGSLFRDDDGSLRFTAPLSEIALPESIRQVIGARVARLGTATQRALSFGAVIGRDFDLDVVARASGIGEDDLLDRFDEAQAAAIITEFDDAPGRYRFAHALIAHTLAQDLGPTRRAHAHRKVAESLEAGLAAELGVDAIDLATIEVLDPGSSGHHGALIRQLAHHYARTDHPADRPRAIAYCAMAGSVALDALAPDEARPWFEQALALSEALDQPDAAIEVDLLIGLGTAQRHSGDQRNRDTLLAAVRRAEALGDPYRLALAVLTLCEGVLSMALGKVDTEKVACLEAALAAMDGKSGVAPGGHPEVSATVKAKLLASLSAELTFGASLERRLAWADEARAIARHLGDPAVIIDVGLRVQYTLDVPDRFDDRLVETAEAFSVARELGDLSLLFWSAWLRSIAAMQAGLPDELAICMEVMEDVNDRLNMPLMAEQTWIRKATMAMLHGLPADAERSATEALQIGMERGQLDAMALFGAQLMMARWQQGRLREILELIERTAAENPAVPAFRAWLAFAHCHCGSGDESRRLFEHAFAEGFESLPRDTAWLHAICVYAELAGEFGHRSATEALFNLLEPWRGQFGANAVIAIGPVAQALGGLAAAMGRFNDADTFFAEAERLNLRMGARFSGTQNDLAWGRMLLARGGVGDINRGLALVERALATAQSYGYPAIAKRAEAALAGT